MDEIKTLEEIIRRAKTGEIVIEKVRREAHDIETEPQNNVRCWERTGEETVTISIRKMKQWITK